MRGCISAQGAASLRFTAATAARRGLSSAACLYDVLGVPRDATAQAIKSAYLKRAKQLHPDLIVVATQNSSAKGSNKEDAAAFLALAAAYEVLSDKARRSAYDAATANKSAKDAHTRANAATHQATHTAATANASAGEAGAASVDVSGWRYGLGQWAARGPPQRSLPHAAAVARHGAVTAMLQRQRHELEADLHAGLLRAFLGPPLCATQQQLGQLPTAFEADERACPSLSIDLLRLVHGRTLLGMVRPMQPLQLQSGEMAGVHAAGLPQTDERRSARELLAGHALLPGASHSTTAPGNDAAVSDAAWTELLQLCYPLHGTYAWAPVPALQQQQLQCTHAGPGTAPPAALWTTAVATSCSRVNDDDGCATQQDTGLPPAADDAETFVPGTLGGGAAQRKWEAAWEAQYGHDAAGCVATSPLCDRQQQKSQQQQQHRHRSQQHHHQQSQQRHHHQSQPHHHQQQQSQQLHQRLWRWLRRPTPEWSSVDWSFNDASDHVLVLQLLQQDGCISALAVRDETQAVKPIKVYVRGTFVAALLDGKVLEPLTGRCLAVSCSYTTPGVKQVIFLAAAVLPGGRGAGRLLARCQRRWMPPSSTWLFPPLSDAHDRGGWLIEWEGHSRELESTSWLHPAVYVLACGVTSHDLEVRRTARRAARAQHWHWLSAPLATLRRACAPMLVWQWGT